jgi:2-polyprenyl-3-methyl-5-hydroxy-6-metoxy-1,4-benzoquinol methylase
MKSKTTTRQKLDRYIGSYTYFNNWLIRRRYEKLKTFFVGDSCLELGPAEGEGTGYLLDHFSQVVAVDGSQTALEAVNNRYSSDNLRVVNSFFENLNLGNEKFTTIILAHILEHVDSPAIVLKEAAKYLADDGVMIIDVPNGNSLHRQVGVKMGLLKYNTELNEADLSIGHQRVYVPEIFKKDILDSGLEISQFGGMFVKVLSNSQTEKVFDADQLEALFTVGEDNPEIAAEIYIIATK